MKRSLLITLLITLSVFLHAQIITTVAGKGTFGYTGDGGLATDALLDDLYYAYPAFDQNGNYYFPQGYRSTIRKIDKFGIISTMAGTIGVAGYSGDGSPATSAKLSRPTSIAIDKNNNIYFADQSNFIRKIDPAGIITTVSGPHSTTCVDMTGRHLSNATFKAISAMVFDKDDNLYISDFGCSVVYKVNTAGILTRIAGNFVESYAGDGGLATSAYLAYPCKVAVDNAGNVYIPDAQNHRVRKVTPTGIITTIAGTGVMGYSGDGSSATAAKLSFPGGVVIDKAGNLYIGEERLIRKIDPSGIITTFAGNGIYGYSGDGGLAINATIVATQGRISIDTNDDIYFCDERFSVIRKISNCLSSTYTQQAINDTLCTSGVATFSVTVNNATSLQWEENNGAGWMTLSDNATYSGTKTTGLTVNANSTFNNAQYRCVATNTCGDIYSQAVKLIVTSPQTPQVSINATATNICAGTTVIFTATPVNGGGAPSYQWKKNGNNIGTNSNTFAANNFVNGDVISCVLTSNNNCLSSTTAASNNITLTVNPLLVPSLTINSSSTSICAGTNVTFTATPVNGGTAPNFQWKKNGLNVGSNQTTYSDNTLSQSDVITCILTSNESCKSNATATSNNLSINITPLITPTITVTASATAICPGTKVTFTATITNGGASPVYRWYKNANYVGTNTAIYEDSTLNNGDKVRCTLTSNANCLSNPTVESNAFVMTVFQQPVVTLDQTPTLCDNGTRQIDAGNFTSYLWQDGSTARSFTVDQLGPYHVQVTDKNGCRAADTTYITTILPAPSKFLPSDTAVCGYDKLTIRPLSNFRSYLWDNNANSSSITISQPKTYWLTVTDQDGCVGTDSILVNPKQCLIGIYVPNAFTPNGDHLNDEIYPIIGGDVVAYEFSIFNRWGTRVFTSKEIGKGWDGRLNSYPQDPSTFTWKCTYQLAGDKPKVASGTIVLIR